MKSVREELEERWDKTIIEEDRLWIYGAGVVARRLYRVICNYGRRNQLNGFVVTDKAGDDIKDGSDEITVFTFKELNEKQKNDTFIVAVSDVYKQEIIFKLKEAGVNRIIDGYAFSFLMEDHVPKDILYDAPNIIDVDIRELMIQQLQFKTDSEKNIDNNLRIEQKDGVFDAVVNERLQIISGAKEIELALEKHQKMVQVYVVEGEIHPEKTESIVKEVEKGWIVPFFGIIWPKALKYKKEIKHIIENEKKVSLKSEQVIRLTEKDFKLFLHEIYITDDVEEWKIREKEKAMAGADTYDIVILELEFLSPDFRIKHQGHTISRSAASLKGKIRNFCSARIQGYVYDVAFHLPDNYKHAEEQKAVIERWGSIDG